MDTFYVVIIMYQFLWLLKILKFYFFSVEKNRKIYQAEVMYYIELFVTAFKISR